VSQKEYNQSEPKEEGVA